MKGPNKLRERCDTEGDALLDLFKKDLAPLSNGRAFGLWGFRYVHSTASLVTFLFSPKRKRREQEQIEEEPIRDGYGSISQVLEDLDVVFIADTASDPRGVVVQTDMQIGQRSACLFPVFGGAPGGALD